MAVEPAAQGGGLEVLTDFVIAAVKLGFLGFGAALFVMVFILLFRNQPAADASTAALRQRFLTLGVVAFLFAGVAQLATAFFGPKPPAERAVHAVSVAFSPAFGEAALPEPTMRVLPSNTAVQQNTPFNVDRDATLMIAIDGVIAKARALSTEAANLQVAAKNLTAANATLSDRAATVAATPATPPLSAATAQRLETLSAQVSADLNRGAFAAAATRSAQLREATDRAME